MQIGGAYIYSWSQTYCSKYTPHLQLHDVWGEALIYSNIRKLCSDRGITIRDLEKACGLGFKSIENWKNHMPTVDNLKAVADFFGVTVDELLN